MELLSDKGEEVLRVGSNVFAFPVVGCEDNEDFIKVTVSIPTGAEKGTEPYDAYEMARAYELKLKVDEQKRKDREAKKAKKIAKDAEVRAKMAEIAKHKDA